MRILINSGKYKIAVNTGAEGKLTIKDIQTRLDAKTMFVEAYRRLDGPKDERKWVNPVDGQLLGKAAVMYNSPSVLKLEIEAQGIRNIWNNRILWWIEYTQQRPFSEPMSRAARAPRSRTVTPPTPPATPKDDGSVMTVTFTGTVEGVVEQMRNFLRFLK